MKPSPLQLKNQFFIKASVETENTASDGQFPSASAMDFNFDGVNIHTELGSAAHEEQLDNPTDYLVDLRIAILNETDVVCPYKIDVRAIGLFVVSENIPLEERVNMVTINGAAVLYGSIREYVSYITSRSLPGTLVLPTVTFIDHKVNVSEPSIPEKPKRSKKIKAKLI